MATVKAKADEVKADAPVDDAGAGSPADGVVVQWVGHKLDRARIRKISAADFRSVGVEDQKAIECDMADPLTKGQVKVSPRAAEYLTDIEEGFVLVDEADLAFGLK